MGGAEAISNGDPFVRITSETRIHSRRPGAGFIHLARVSTGISFGS
jgi:hypothetical protein